tara:strand:+ start:1005 stop:1409 length:405 start_codon:yes stop_codon:yes gene_type:complete
MNEAERKEYVESVTTISIAGIIDRNLRMHDTLYELDHFISVEAGGYTQEEFDEAAENFNDIVERIAKQIFEEVRRDKTRLADQIDSLKRQVDELRKMYSDAQDVLNTNQQLEMEDEDSRDISEMEYDPASGSYH